MDHNFLLQFQFLFFFFYSLKKKKIINFIYIPLDLNECNTYGSCSQMCVNTDGSYTCSCVEGYVLQPDNKSCKAKNGKF